ncbi:TetR/AcrR family transcriptional regulator [candidate division KSB1 bacterium]|nr:TetR/AcrR family transcriptional regulator [candidate division KSB1 bacterium]
MPKIIDKEEKRQAILIAAMKVFAQKGIANTKMTDIADAAGIGKGTIYEYFRNKEEIFQASYSVFMESMEATIAQRIFKITDPVEKLKALFRAMTETFAGSGADFMDMMLDFWAEAVRQKDESKIKIVDLHKIYADFRQIIGAILDEGIRLGKFKHMNTFMAASIMIGAMDGIMLQWIMDRKNFNANEAVECFLNELLAGIYIT